MPVPHSLAETFVFVHGNNRLDPPPPGATARIPAKVAWAHLSSSEGGRGGSGSLVLARLTNTTPARRLPDGTLGEDTHDVLAWVLYTHDTAVNRALVSGPPAGPNYHRPAPSQPCVFLDGLDAMNATTGQVLLTEGETAEHDPVRP